MSHVKKTLYLRNQLDLYATLLDYARREVELIYVGKEASNHTVPQNEINQVLVDLAKNGKNVVRLKGGDPFIFGRARHR